jgi:hypothetical protein
METVAISKKLDNLSLEHHKLPDSVVKLCNVIVVGLFSNFKSVIIGTCGNIREKLGVI